MVSPLRYLPTCLKSNHLRELGLSVSDSVIEITFLKAETNNK